MDFEEHVLDHQLAGVNGNIYAVGPGTSRTKVRKKREPVGFFVEYQGLPIEFLRKMQVLLYKINGMLK